MFVLSCHCTTINTTIEGSGKIYKSGWLHKTAEAYVRRGKLSIPFDSDSKNYG